MTATKWFKRLLHSHVTTPIFAFEFLQHNQAQWMMNIFSFEQSKKTGPVVKSHWPDMNVGVVMCKKWHSIVKYRHLLNHNLFNVSFKFSLQSQDWLIWLTLFSSLDPISARDNLIYICQFRTSNWNIAATTWLLSFCLSDYLNTISLGAKGFFYIRTTK